MAADCTRVVVRSRLWPPDGSATPSRSADAGRRRLGRHPARAQGAGHPDERDHLAGHHLGRARRPARQPHAQPGRGAVRRGGIRRRSGRVSGRAAERYGPVVRAAASESRSQARNRQLALERLADAVGRGAAGRPDPAPTRPTKGSQVRRVEEKRHRSEVKRRRRPPATATTSGGAQGPRRRGLSRPARAGPPRRPGPRRAARTARGRRRPVVPAGR